MALLHRFEELHPSCPQSFSKVCQLFWFGKYESSNVAFLGDVRSFGTNLLHDMLGTNNYRKVEFRLESLSFLMILGNCFEHKSLEIRQSPQLLSQGAVSYERGTPVPPALLTLAAGSAALLGPGGGTTGSYLPPEGRRPLPIQGYLVHKKPPSRRTLQ